MELSSPKILNKSFLNFLAPEKLNKTFLNFIAQKKLNKTFLYSYFLYFSKKSCE